MKKSVYLQNLQEALDNRDTEAFLDVLINYIIDFYNVADIEKTLHLYSNELEDIMFKGDVSLTDLFRVLKLVNLELSITTQFKSLPLER